jgi:HlyD family secretion protein
VLVTFGLVGIALRPRPIIVETARVTRGSLAATVTEDGKTRVRQLYVVATPVDGQLERIAAQPGDPVRAGTVIARVWPISPRPLDVRSRAEGTAVVAAARSAVTQAEATEQEARVTLTHAQTQFDTFSTLVRDGAMAPKEAEHAGHDVDARRQALEAASAAVKVAQSELARAEARLATNSAPDVRPAAVVTAPITGSILRVLHESAGPVTAGTALFEIGDTSAIEVVADFLTADALALPLGADALLTGWGGRAIPARVRRVDPAAFTKVSALGLEEQRVHVVLDFVGQAPRGLAHDFRVSVAVVAWKGENVLLVPSTSLFRVGDEWAVFVVKNGRAALKNVRAGHTDGSRTVIETGLAADEDIVVQPSDGIRDGSRVQPEAAANGR